MPVVKSRAWLSGMVTQLLEPLKERALPNRPAVVQVALAIVPFKFLPEESVARVPTPSSKPQEPTSPATTVKCDRVKETPADVRALPAASRARAVTVCGPLLAPTLFQAI